MLNEESLSKEKERMTELLTEEKINAFLRGSSTTFYDLTHSMYIEEFAKLNNDSSISSWAKKIGMVYSWIPGISSSAFDYQDRLEDVQTYADELTGLLKPLKNCNLEDFTLDFKNKTITCNLDTKKNNTIKFERLQKLIGKLMHGNVNTDGQIATNSKMLHFSAPHLFPIMDKNICKVVFKKETPTLKNYILYMYLIQNYLNKKAIKDSVKNSPISKLYVIDGVLFNEGR